MADPYPSSMMAEDSILDRQTVWNLLNPTIKPVWTLEEERRPWRICHLSPKFEMPFLRIWDRYSGSQPDEEDTMMSRALRQRLDTYKSRKASLTTHINHGDWTPTPYISFTTSAAAIEDLVDKRAREGRRGQRGDQILTVVDPKIRVRDGLPILNVGAELDHYGKEDLYDKSKQYHKDHYVCLWQVTTDQIVGHCKWSHLEEHRNSYHDIIMPAFQKFRESKTVPVAQKLKAFDLTAMRDSLHFTSDLSNRPTNLFCGDSNTSGKGRINYHEEEDSRHKTSEGGGCYYGDEEGSDTDDEVEDANAADDFLNAL